MANRTVKDALSVRGTNPQYLIEKIIRSRIYDSRYWKEECFALSAELLVDKAMELKFVGGVHAGNIKPSPFLCLILKMLQIQPEKDIVIEFIRQENFKYVRALGALYMRLVGTSLDCYKYLEPLYNDFRKLKKQTRQATFEVIHVDEFIDELLHEERVCDVILPRIQKRQVLEDTSELVPRISALEDDLEGPDSDEEDKDIIQAHKNIRERSIVVPVVHRRHSPSHRRAYSPRRHYEHDRDRQRRRSRSRERERIKPREKDRRHRSRSRSVEKKSHDRKYGHSSSKHSHRSRDEREHRRNITEDERKIIEVNTLRARLGLAPLKL